MLHGFTLAERARYSISFVSTNYMCFFMENILLQFHQILLKKEKRINQIWFIKLLSDI